MVTGCNKEFAVNEPWWFYFPETNAPLEKGWTIEKENLDIKCGEKSARWYGEIRGLRFCERCMKRVGGLW